MRCPKCDANVSNDTNRCIYCGQDLSTIRFVERVSNSYYNKGLERAKIRDLSGAADMLSKSLQFNKCNTQARNLLGLVYFELGEIVSALSQWVLSKYFQPEKNRADYYMAKVQKNQTRLDAINHTIKKYNSALSAATVGNYDLAVIQLKKVMQQNPKFVRAGQLLALLYIHQGSYYDASKVLKNIRKVDVNNTTTLRYMKELREHAVVKENRAETKKQKETLQNVTPVGTYQEEKRSFMPVVYVILGIIVGILVCFVLIRPTLQNNKAGGEDKKQIETLQTQVDSYEKEQENLNQKITDLNKQIEQGNTEALQKVSNYEKLLKGLQAYIDSDPIQAAVEVADCKKSDFDSEEAKTLYQKISVLTPEQVDTLVNQGYQEMNNSYDTAMTTFRKVLKVDAKNQRAMLYLGRCYHLQNKYKKAKKWYQKAIDTDSTTEAGLQAKRYLDQLPS